MTTQMKWYIGKFTATCAKQAFFSIKTNTTPHTQLSKKPKQEKWNYVMRGEEEHFTL